MTYEGSRAVIYTRISMDRDGEGVPLARQEEACRALAVARGFTVVAVLGDTQSAYDPKPRPQWNRVLEMARTGQVEVVLAYNVDRFTRSVRTNLEMGEVAQQHQVAFITSQGDLDYTTGQGRFLALILAGIAQYEVELKSQRQKLANRGLAREGNFFSGGFRAFGFNKDGTHVPEEAEAIRQAAEDVLAGVSLKEIARRWEAAGLETGRAGSGVWRLQSVRAVLLNAKNAGIRTYKGTRVATGKWEPIISEATHIELKAFLTNPSRKVGGNPGGKTAQNLLSGIATCSRCEEPVRSGSARGLKVYTCARGCVSTSRSEADDFVRDTIASVAVTLGPPDSFTSSREDNEVSQELLVDETRKLESRKTTLVGAMTRGAISEEEFDTGLASLNDQLAALAALTPQSPPTFFRLNEGGEEFAAVVRGGSIAAQREALQLAIGNYRGHSGTVVLKPKGRGRRNVPIEDQVEVWLPYLGELIAGHRFNQEIDDEEDDEEGEA